MRAMVLSLTRSRWRRIRKYRGITRCSVSASVLCAEGRDAYLGVDAIMNPSAALQSTAEDFLESLPNSPGPSQAEVINCILRACGCNDSVDGDEVLDYDGVVDALDNFTEALKQVCFIIQGSHNSRLTYNRMTPPYTRSRRNYPHSRNSASPYPSSSLD